MNNYEIMLILDPNSTQEIVEKIISETFKSKPEIKELENIELAYEINKSKTGKYILVNIKAEGSEIIEFNRKANIQKPIWRSLVINLDTEKGLNRKANPKRVKVHPNRRYNRFGPNPRTHEGLPKVDIKPINKEKPKEEVQADE